MKSINWQNPLIIAGLLVLVLALWLGSGQVVGNAEPETSAAASDDDEQIVNVRTRLSRAEPFVERQLVRARTRPLMAVTVASEIDARVVATPVEKGTRVARGDVICRLEPGPRPAALAEGRALIAQRQADYDRIKKLVAQGHRAETDEIAAHAAYQAARAQTALALAEMSNTEIRSPFDGLLDDRHVDVGAYMTKGDPCGLVVFLDPFLVVGQVSESAVGKLAVGAEAEARLVDNSTIAGTIRYIAATADPQTRSYRIEVEVANPDGRLRDGMSATLSIVTGELMAHQLSQSTLVLGDSGEIGVRVVDRDGRARFKPVSVLQDDKRRVWVAGLSPREQIITVGQEFARDGEPVRAEPEDPSKATS